MPAESTPNETFEIRYDEEAYLFQVVGPRFHREGSLSAYDLFFIVRWKANRAITNIAKHLTRLSKTDLEQASRNLTREIHDALTDEERFLVISDKWKLALPMASAILTVLYPEFFTVYDVRVCDELGDFHKLANLTKVNSRWQGYLAFKAAVEKKAPANLSLRDKDRYLWAESRHKSLEAFLKRDFSK
jgi:hypothetical protein